MVSVTFRNKKTKKGKFRGKKYFIKVRVKYILGILC